MCLAASLLTSAVIGAMQITYGQGTPATGPAATAPAATQQARGAGRRGRANQPPLADENSSLANLALVASVGTSFVSGDQTILAINDGQNPRMSRDHYGNW